MSLPQDVLELRPELIALRRELHQRPELAFQEHETAARVESFLRDRGLSVRTGLGGTGVMAQVSGGAGRTVLLRVDMDGLPIEEEGESPYASRIKGRMHACGHDGHVAMGAGAARILAGRRLPGTAKILFQPAEEGEGGAQAVIADGVLEGVDLVVGVHLWNELPVGTLGVKAGPLMAAVDRLKIVVRGRGGHGGQPQRAADPVVAAAHLVTALQTLVSREVGPLEPAVLTIGSIHGGHAFNVIPDEVTLTGTIRSFDPELRRSLPERVARIASGVALGLRCQAEVEVRAGNPPVINDPQVAEIARRAAIRVVGEDKVVSPQPTMGGEDMAVYFERVPGCFVFVGSANPARGLAEPHHSPRFDFDEEALAIGCAFLVEAAFEALQADSA
ncbi:MAG TPA: amidohydrolase [Vicinamibacteria bacterium]|nr:amidohydrolase [Vicinamibacteria bacterium]